MKIYKHPSVEQVYGYCEYCERDILVGDKFTRMLEGITKFNLHDECYEPYIAKRFQKRPMIAGVSHE